MDNFIKIYDNVLDDKLCNGIIDIFESSPYLRDGATSGGVDYSKKRSTDLTMFDYDEYEELNQYILQIAFNKFVEYFDEYYFIILSMFDLTVYHPITHQPTKLTAENYHEVGRPQMSILMNQLFDILPPQIQKYQKGLGGYPYWHSETYPQQNSDETIRRVLLYIFYLNDVDDGGETEFFYQQIKCKPKRGSMVIAPCYFTHTHRGNIPKSNDKYIMTSWLSFKDSKSIYGINK
jgi:hypothetical protein